MYRPDMIIKKNKKTSIFEKNNKKNIADVKNEP